MWGWGPEGGGGACAGARWVGAPSPRRSPPRLSLVHVTRFSLTPPQLLARHRRQAVLLVVWHLALPHDEDDLQPLGAQRAERLAMRVASRPLLVVAWPLPRTRQQRAVRHLSDHAPQ